MSGALHRARRLLGPVLIVLVALFLGRALLQSWGEVWQYEWRFDLPYLLLSVVLILLYYAQQWGGWWLVMRSFGADLGRSESAAIWFASILGRYVPGNVAMVAGRIGMCRRRNIPARTTLASMVYENTLILVSALLVAAASVPFWPSFPYKGHAVLLAALAPLGLALLHPAVFGRAANAALRRSKRDPLEAVLPFPTVLALLVYYLGGWVLLGIAFASLTAAIAPVGMGALLLLIGGYAFAWEVGFLSFLTPSGLGVKEAVLFAVLLLILPSPLAAAIVVLSRLWQTLAEVSAAGAVWAFARSRSYLG